MVFLLFSYDFPMVSIISNHLNGWIVSDCAVLRCISQPFGVRLGDEVFGEDVVASFICGRPVQYDPSLVNMLYMLNIWLNQVCVEYGENHDDLKGFSYMLSYVDDVQRKIMVEFEVSMANLQVGCVSLLMFDSHPSQARWWII